MTSGLLVQSGRALLSCGGRSVPRLPHAAGSPTVPAEHQERGWEARTSGHCVLLTPEIGLRFSYIYLKDRAGEQDFLLCLLVLSPDPCRSELAQSGAKELQPDLWRGGRDQVLALSSGHCRCTLTGKAEPRALPPQRGVQAFQD